MLKLFSAVKLIKKGTVQEKRRNFVFLAHVLLTLNKLRTLINALVVSLKIVETTELTLVADTLKR